MFNTGYTSSDGRFKTNFQQDKVVKGEDGFSPIVEVEEIENGHRVYITDKENTYFFELFNGKTGPMGPVGPQGEQGIQGIRGEPGYTPYVGPNGNWWVGDTDTGVFTNTSVIDVIDLPTENINTKATYRLLTGTLYLNGLIRNDCNCIMVQWGNNSTNNRPNEGLPLIIGEYSSLSNTGFNIYYNMDNDSLWGYFDDTSLNSIYKYIDNNYQSLVARTLKTIITNLVRSSRWISLSNILSSGVQSYISLHWGGIVGEISGTMLATMNYLYLLLRTETYGYIENVWVKTLRGPARFGKGKSSSVAGHIRNIASGDMSVAFGNQTQALGSSSVAGGYLSVANGPTGFAFGDHVISSGICFSIGKYNISSNNNIFEVGCGTEQARRNALEIQSLTGNINFYAPATFNSAIQVKDYISFGENYRLVYENGSLSWQFWAGNNKMSHGNIIIERTLGEAFKKYRIQTGAKSSSSVEANSTAEGINNVATGLVSHAEGAETQALGVTAHSEGYGTQALADYSHSEGLSTEARGIVSHAEGGATIAEGPYSHTEGQNCSTTIEALWAHAEGVNTVALAMATHTEGNGTIAASYCQHVQGQFNLVDEETKYVHIVGKGADDDNRSNAHTLDWNGNAWFAGAVLTGGESMDDENAELLITSGVLTKLLNKLSEKGIEISIDELLS